MESKSLKNLNQQVLTVFKDWIQFLPIQWLNNLTPEMFSEKTNIDIDVARQFFDGLIKFNFAQAKIRLRCPNCRDEETINYIDIDAETICSECEQTFIPRDFLRDGDVLYKINKKDFTEHYIERVLSPVERLLKSQPQENCRINTDKKVIYLENINSYEDSIIGEYSSEEQQTKSMNIFISYSHEDIAYLERLKVHLKPLEREQLIDLWDDTKIKSGQRWKKEIEKAISAARVAILLISADFLASDFITNNELPPLLKAAEERGTTILPVIVKPCRFLQTASISCFQAVNDPLNTVSQLSEPEQEKLWVKLSEDISYYLNR